MTRRGRRANRTATRLAAAVAVAVVTAMAVAAGRARLDTPAPKAAVLVTAKPLTPAAAPTTIDRSRATTTTSPATTTRPSPTTTTTSTPVTSTTRPAPPRTTTTVRTRATCLALADANHYAVIAANYRWFQEQVRNLSPDPVLAARQYEALRIEETWALKEIDAQYAIDKSNCYLD
jgi:hypothetical protein